MRKQFDCSTKSLFGVCSGERVNFETFDYFLFSLLTGQSYHLPFTVYLAAMPLQSIASPPKYQHKYPYVPEYSSITPSLLTSVANMATGCSGHNK